jgi:hypothetical protein
MAYKAWKDDDTAPDEIADAILAQPSMARVKALVDAAVDWDEYWRRGDYERPWLSQVGTLRWLNSLETNALHRAVDALPVFPRVTVEPTEDTDD